MSETAIDLNQLQSQLERHLKTQRGETDPIDVTLLAHGEANAIFRWLQPEGSSLIRVAISSPNQRFAGDPSRVTQFEYQVLKYLKGSGLSHDLQDQQLTPTSDFPYTYLITNYLDGVPLDYSRQHLHQCAETLARLHRLSEQDPYTVEPLQQHLTTVDQPLTLFYQESVQYAQPYVEWSGANPEFVSMLKSVLEAARIHLAKEVWLQEYPYQCLVHGDHTYGNWVINPNQAFLIDWEWAEVGTPAGDLGHFLSPVTIYRKQGFELPASEQAYFLECYYTALQNPELALMMQKHFEAFSPFPALRSLCWTAGYWLSASRWYGDVQNPDTAEGLRRLEDSQRHFPYIWQAVMTRFNGS